MFGNKPRLRSRVVLTGSVCLAAIAITSCQTAYYATMEAMGVHKRDILVNRIEDARDDQQEAKEQFQSALEQFRTVIAFEGGELEQKYNKLSAELDRSEARADAVENSIRDVERVAEALFDEWEAELEDYSSESLRRESAMQLDRTRQRYASLMTTMSRVEARIEPVLSVFRDQVLFLKHNLNARAIASIQSELDTIEADVASLIQEMEVSIAEADEFISEMSAE